MIIRIECDSGKEKGMYVEKKIYSVDLVEIYEEIGNLLIAYGFHPGSIEELFGNEK